MVDTVNSSKIWVDQTLHGYAGGHRLLAGSAKLQEGDARTMLVLSDSSSTRFSDADHGYIAGYPLTSASKYVLARTWPAPEMSRPGCVWTHSLLIGFADLATISSAEGLLALFRRPHPSTTGYDGKLFLLSDRGIPASSQHPKAAALLDALYLEPSSKVEMRAGHPFEDEALILAIWLQQWPRLRRSFRFCSLTGADRSMLNEQFDLQLVANLSPAKRSVIPGAKTLDEVSGDSRLSSALADIRRPNDLRSFLLSVGGDVPSGRSAMFALCQLHDALRQAERGEVSLDTALDAFDLLGVQQARAARTMVLEHALSRVEKVDDRTFRFICDSVEQNGDVLEPDKLTRLGVGMWRRSPAKFIVALADDGALGRITSSALSSLEGWELADGVFAHPEIAGVIAKARRDVLAVPRFWDAQNLDLRELLGPIDAEASGNILLAIISAGRSDAAADVVQKFGSARTLEAIGSADIASGVADLPSWLYWIARSPMALGVPLSSGLLARRVVIGLAKLLNPDDVPNDYGDDPWAIAARASTDLDAYEENRFAAFLMARALGYRSRSSAELLCRSFDRVHGSLADGTMPSDGWQMIEYRLHWPGLWGEWDKCGRVREAVAAKFVDLGLDPVLFIRLTDSSAIFRDLAEIVVKTRSGRRYIEQARKALRNEPEGFVQMRAKILEKLT